jgi:hypothetical protein
MLKLVALVYLALGLIGCPSGQTAENPLMHGMKDPSKVVQEGCQLAQQKCTRCHTIERLLATSPSDAHVWRRYVRRMRLMPSASIQVSEEPKIVQCLVYRDFGIEGLAALEGAGQ